MSNKSASMTVRGIDEEVSFALKERARRDGISVNALALRIIREGLDLKRKKGRRNMMTLTILLVHGPRRMSLSSSRQHACSRTWMRTSGNKKHGRGSDFIDKSIYFYKIRYSPGF